MQDAAEDRKATSDDDEVVAPPRAFLETVRDARARFDASIEPVRPALYAYCRRLTGHPFDAEDLHQDTVLRAFGALSERFEPLRDPKAYLFRIATRLWIDRTRRDTVRREGAQRLDAPDAVPAAATPGRSELRDAAARLLDALPPREAAVLVLRDVFDFSVREAAAIAGCSEAAVKMATTRARRRVAAAGAEPTATTPETRAVLDEFVARFERRDLEGLLALFDEHAQARVLGCAQEEGRDEIRRGSLQYALGSAGVLRSDVVEAGGEALVAFRYATDAGPAVGDLARLHVEDGRIARLELYYFSPDLLAEVAALVGEPCVTHGYAPPARDWWNLPDG